jgi:hypothetical protein
MEVRIESQTSYGLREKTKQQPTQTIMNNERFKGANLLLQKTIVILYFSSFKLAYSFWPLKKLNLK